MVSNRLYQDKILKCIMSSSAQTYVFICQSDLLVTKRGGDFCFQPKIVHFIYSSTKT